MNHNRARKKNVWSDKSQNFRVGTNRKQRTPQRGCLHMNLSGFSMGAKHRKKGLSPGSAHHISFHYLPTRPAHPPQTWQEGLGLCKSWLRKRGSRTSTHVHVFFLCREVLRPQCWYSSHLGNTKALSHLTGSLLSAGRSDTFTINCSGFDWHGVDPAVFQTIFSQKDFRPVINYSIPTQVNISFTVSAILDVVSSTFFP